MSPGLLNASLDEIRSLFATNEVLFWRTLSSGMMPKSLFFAYSVLIMNIVI